jgi:hypothetical protein
MDITYMMKTDHLELVEVMRKRMKLRIRSYQDKGDYGMVIALYNVLLCMEAEADEIYSEYTFSTKRANKMRLEWLDKYQEEAEGDEKESKTRKKTRKSNS